MAARIEQYRKILGIGTDFTADELRKCYRNRAKELHPDRNKSAAAHDKFVLLHEAYEYHIQLLKGIGEVSQAENAFGSKKYPKHYSTETWNYKRRMEARRRAATRAKMRYEQFNRKGYPQILDRMFLAFDYLRLVLAGMIVLVMPIFLYERQGNTGLLIALFVQAVTYPLWSKAILRFV